MPILQILGQSSESGGYAKTSASTGGKIVGRGDNLAVEERSLHQGGACSDKFMEQTINHINQVRERGRGRGRRSHFKQYL